MPAPQLQAYVNGQTAPVTADNLNSFVQSCDTITQLSGFIGLRGIQVYVRGTTIPGDGGQGMFYWNASAPGPGNGNSVIVPIGVATGAWIRLSSDGPSSGTLVPITTNYQVLGTESLIEADATAGPITITYNPTISYLRPVTIVKIDSSPNPVYISDGTVVQGALATPAVGEQMQSQIVYSNGTALRLI